MDEKQFYTYKDGSKTELCKKCLTMHLDLFEPDTFTWIMKKLDIPYIPEEWNILRDRAYAKDPNKVNPTAIFGKYISKMKLKKWKDYTWEDSEKLQKEALDARTEYLSAHPELEKKRARVEEAYKKGEISEEEYKTYVSTETINEKLSSEIPTNLKEIVPEIRLSAGPAENFANFFSESELAEKAESELTQDDRLFLAMKWGRFYKPAEWVELETKYTEFTNSFDIQDADSKNTIILICKTLLKMNQALDAGDVDGYQKLSRVYDSMRKSVKLTAAQNKDAKGNEIDCIGTLVDMCEKQGFIPRFATNIPQDKVDLTLKDMNHYVHNLVTQDLGFGQQIEDALKKIQIQKELNEQSDDFDFEGEETSVETEDYEKFFDFQEEQVQQDKATKGEIK